jgi:hypothetical protein
MSRATAPQPGIPKGGAAANPRSSSAKGDSALSALK